MNRATSPVLLVDKCVKLAGFYSADYEESSANVDIHAVDLKYADPLRSEAAYIFT